MTAVLLDPALTLVDGDWAAAVSAAGTTQSDATTLTAYHNYVTTCAAGAGVALTAQAAGRQFTVFNATSNTCLVYPPTSGQINGATANLPVSIPANGGAWFKVFSTTKFGCVVGAGS